MPVSPESTLLTTLQHRFDANPGRHRGIEWRDVLQRLEASPDAWRAIAEMERTGGEPDVVGQDPATGALLIVDCCAETPIGRRSLCFDPAALDARKENKPAGSALGMAADMGITLLGEAEYHALQALGPFDTKTSSWLATPPPLRALGGALFGDRRYDRVFIYHNGAQSYYSVRGFRGMVRV